MGLLLYTLAFVGGVTLILLLIGVIATAFQGMPATDYIEDTLKEVSKKRGRRK